MKGGQLPTNQLHDINCMYHTYVVTGYILVYIHIGSQLPCTCMILQGTCKVALHVHVPTMLSHLDLTLIICLPTLYAGIGSPAFYQGATGALSTSQSVIYPAQVQHPTPFGVHAGWSV